MALPNVSNDYKSLLDKLRINYDAQFGIDSGEIGGEWVRDATKVVPNKDYPSHDDPLLYANSMLQRCLGRLRPVLHAVEKKHGENNRQINTAVKLAKDFFEQKYQASQEVIKDDLPDKEKRKILDKYEAEISTNIVELLHKAGLTSDCGDAKSASSLLQHYRILSSVLDKPRPLVTISYDKTSKLLIRETNYPVTEKSDEQKEKIKNSIPEPGEALDWYYREGKETAQNTRNLAEQEANVLFRDLLLDDKRMLSAQARKRFLVGAKNAFIGKVESVKVDELPNNPAETFSPRDPNTFYFARCGSPVYIGRGETDEDILKHAQHNLEQIRKKYENLSGKEYPKLDVYALVTNTIFILDEKKMVRNMRKLSGTNNINVIYEPVNQYAAWWSLRKHSSRVRDVVSRILSSDLKEKLNVFHCASGQDRTGMVAHLYVEGRLAKLHKLKKEENSLSEVHSLAAHAAETVGMQSPGCSGIKPETCPYSTMLGKNTRHVVRKSAQNNKRDKVLPNVSFLRKNLSPVINKELLDANTKIDNIVNRGELLNTAVKDLQKQINVLYKQKPQHGKILVSMLDKCHDVLTKGDISTEKGRNEKLNHCVELIKMANQAEKKWHTGARELGQGLLCAAGVALAVMSFASIALGNPMAVLFAFLAVACFVAAGKLRSDAQKLTDNAAKIRDALMPPDIRHELFMNNLASFDCKK